MPRPLGTDALVGFAIGAAFGLGAHLVALALSAGPGADAASQRITVELLRLGAEKSAFVAALAIAVALVSGPIGLLMMLLLRFARLRTIWAGPATALVLVGCVLRAFVAQPALLEPSLGGARGALARPLSHLTALGPRAFDLLALIVVTALLAVGARRRHKIKQVALVSLGALAIALAPRLFSTRTKPALVVIAADSLRPDRMSDVTAPNLRALAARGVSFDALSPIASTTPAWLSILTGRHPHAHGIRHLFPRRELRPAWLDTLPRRLRAAGISTAIASDYAGDFLATIDLGFDEIRAAPPLDLGVVYQREVLLRSPLALALLNHRLAHALFPVFRFLPTNADPERLTDDALSMLRENRALFVFYSTTHVPFAAPWPDYRRFASPNYGGTHRYLYDVQRLSDLKDADAALPAADVAQIRGLYDGALHATDRAIGRLLDAIDPATPIVLLSDHGENLFEPGNTTFHGKWFEGGDEANRVPLLFAGAGVPRGVRVPERVSLLDVAPTVADWLKLGPFDSDGISLVSAFAGHAPARELFAETGLWLNGPPFKDGLPTPPLHVLLEADARDHFQLVLATRWEDLAVEAKHRALWSGTHKLVYVPTENGVRYALYDLAADARQTRDLYSTSSEAPGLTRAMRKFLLRDPERELDARDHLLRRTED